MKNQILTIRRIALKLDGVLEELQGLFFFQRRRRKELLLQARDLVTKILQQRWTA